MKLLVSKQGAVLRDFINSPVGEVGETMAIMQYLLSQGHEVYYFGRYVGHVPLRQYGIVHLDPMYDDLHDLTTVAQQERNSDADAKMVEPFGFEYYLQTSGYPAARSVVRCFDGQLQAAAIRYTGPCVGLMIRVPMKRIVINTDATCYPNNREMHLYPHIMPWSVLSQKTEVIDRVIGFKKMRISAVYCGSENWIDYERQEFGGDKEIIMLANNWGTKKGRDTYYHKLIGDRVQLFGNGFDKYIRPCELRHVLSQYKYGCCVSNIPGWYSFKMKEYLLNGVVPFLLDDGPGRVDCEEIYVGKSSPLRVKSYEHMIAVIEVFGYDALVHEAKKILACMDADYSLLDRCLAGEKIGGYEYV